MDRPSGCLRHAAGRLFREHVCRCWRRGVVAAARRALGGWHDAISSLAARVRPAVWVARLQRAYWAREPLLRVSLLRPELQSACRTLSCRGLWRDVRGDAAVLDRF